MTIGWASGSIRSGAIRLARNRARGSSRGELLFAGLAFFFKMTLDGCFSLFFLSFLFLAESFLDGSIVLFVIELAEIIRFSLHALGDLLFYNSK